MVGYPEPEDGTVIHCSRGEDTPWLPVSPFQFPPFAIPLDSNSIFVISGGQQGTGTVQVELDRMAVNNEITVDITAQYYDQDARQDATVCLMEKGKGELGVGVFVSNGSFKTVTCSPPTKRHRNTRDGRTGGQSLISH